VRGRVPSTNCFETWEARWKFAGTYVALGGGRTEQLIMNCAPSPVLQGAIAEEGPRAQANGQTRQGTASAVLKVTASPGHGTRTTGPGSVPRF
jgi:hypothetical protein